MPGIHPRIVNRMLINCIEQSARRAMKEAKKKNAQSQRRSLALGKHPEVAGKWQQGSGYERVRERERGQGESEPCKYLKR